MQISFHVDVAASPSIRRVSPFSEVAEQAAPPDFLKVHFPLAFSRARSGRVETLAAGPSLSAGERSGSERRMAVVSVTRDSETS